MKTLAPLTQDGFKASIELLRFQREQNNDLIHAITSIVGTAPTFIKGGDITQAGGNTTITSGIVCYNEKLYTFTGGVYAGTPASLKVLFEENTAAGYPQPYFVGDPVPKDIYLSRTARIDTTGTLFLNAIGKIFDFIKIKNDITNILENYEHRTNGFLISPQSPFSGYIIGDELNLLGIRISGVLRHSATINKNTVLCTIPIPNITSHFRAYSINSPNNATYNYTNNTFVDFYIHPNSASDSIVRLGTALTSMHNLTHFYAII
jgi:hypothetical protein